MANRRYFIHCTIAECDVILPLETYEWVGLGPIQLEEVGKAMVAAIPSATYGYVTEEDNR